MVEIALSVALVGIISISLALIFRTSTDLVSSSEEENELLQSGRNGINRIVAELKHADTIYELESDYIWFRSSHTLGGATVKKSIAYTYSQDTIWRWINGSDWEPFIEDATYIHFGGMTLWSTLDDELEVQYPKIGPNGMLMGDYEFTSMRFGNGFHSAPDMPISNIRYPASDVVHKDSGTIEFWYRPSHEFEDNSGITSKQLLNVSCGATGNHINFFFDAGSEKLYYDLNIGAWRRIAWTPDWEAGSLVHIAIVWDSSGKDIGEGQTMALFVDGVQRSDNGAVITSNWTADGTFSSDLMMGDDGHSVTGDAAFDNLKVFNYCKTNFDDRYREDAWGTVTVEIGLNNGEDEITLRSAANVK